MVFQQVLDGLQLDMKLRSLLHSLHCNMDAWLYRSLSFSKQGHTVILVFWQPSNDEWVKFNCNRASTGNSGRSDTGSVIRNHMEAGLWAIIFD